tara:strand:- start:274 stop:909 length:636 start_codon:yes stop_codon:yes gene_type:complete
MYEIVGTISDLNLNIILEAAIVLATFVGGFAIGLKRIPKFKPSPQKDKNYWKLHSNIHEVLTELRIKTGCARAQAIQFHNGEYFMDGVCMRMKTLTHESIARGVQGEGRIKQRLQLSMFIPLMEIIIRNKPDVHLIETCEESYCKQFMESSNVVSFGVLPLKKAGMITGYIMCQWCSVQKTKSLKKSVVEEELTKARDMIEVHINQQKAGN